MDDDAAENVPLLLSSTTEDPKVAKTLGRALFRRLKTLAIARSAQLQVLTTGFHRFSSHGYDEPTKAFMSGASQILADEGIAFDDCSDELLSRSANDVSSITIEGDGHPNERCARMIAELNWPYVRRMLKNIQRINDENFAEN